MGHIFCWVHSFVGAFESTKLFSNTKERSSSFHWNCFVSSYPKSLLCFFFLSKICIIIICIMEICMPIICRKILINRIDQNLVWQKRAVRGPHFHLCASYQSLCIWISIFHLFKINFSFVFFASYAIFFCKSRKFSHFSISVFLFLWTQCLHRSKFRHNPSLDSM